MVRTGTEDERHRLIRPTPTATGRQVIVVDAFIDLVLERSAPPTPEDIADRVGVSRATFFRYFSSLTELRCAAGARVVERFPELFSIPALSDGSLDDRIRCFVDARVRLHEALHPLELLIRAHATHDADSTAFIEAARRVLAEQARQYFAADLQRHGRSHRDDLVTAIAILTSIESWQQFRHAHHRSPVQTRRAWRTVLAGILTAHRPELAGVTPG